MADEITYSINEVVAELDELGRAKWETAQLRVENRKLREELARLANAGNGGSTAEVPTGG